MPLESALRAASDDFVPEAPKVDRAQGVSRLERQITQLKSLILRKKAQETPQPSVRSCHVNEVKTQRASWKWWSHSLRRCVWEDRNGDYRSRNTWKGRPWGNGYTEGTPVQG